MDCYELSQNERERKGCEKREERGKEKLLVLKLMDDYGIRNKRMEEEGERKREQTKGRRNERKKEKKVMRRSDFNYDINNGSA